MKAGEEMDEKGGKEEIASGSITCIVLGFCWGCLPNYKLSHPILKSQLLVEG